MVVWDRNPPPLATWLGLMIVGAKIPTVMERERMHSRGARDKPVQIICVEERVLRRFLPNSSQRSLIDVELPKRRKTRQGLF